MKRKGVVIRRCFFLPELFLLILSPAKAERVTFYAGATSSDARYVGASLGGDLFPYLQLQFDIFKFTEKDNSLYSENRAEDRSDFLGASLNFALRLPIYLIPGLDKLNFIYPYLLAGYGAGLENLSSVYLEVPDVDGDTGIFSKLRQYHTYGAGLVIMLTSKFGLKFDYRNVSMPGLTGMGYSSRKFSRYSFGICIGPTD